MTIDPDLCIGSGECVRVAPAAFQLSEEEGIAVPQPGAAAEDPAQLVLAARNCPTRAIQVVAADGTVLYER